MDRCQCSSSPPGRKLHCFPLECSCLWQGLFFWLSYVGLGIKPRVPCALPGATSPLFLLTMLLSLQSSWITGLRFPQCFSSCALASWYLVCPVSLILQTWCSSVLPQRFLRACWVVSLSLQWTHTTPDGSVCLLLGFVSFVNLKTLGFFFFDWLAMFILF